MANTRGNAKTTRSSQPATQAKAIRPTKPVSRPKPKPISKAKPTSNAKPMSKAKSNGDRSPRDASSGESEGDEQEALRSKIAALERQLGKKKKGSSVNPVIEAQREDSRKRSLAMLEQDALERDDDYSTDDQKQRTKRRKEVCTTLDEDEDELARIMQDGDDDDNDEGEHDDTDGKDDEPEEDQGHRLDEMMVGEEEQEQETKGQHDVKSKSFKSATPAIESEPAGGRRELKGVLHSFPGKVSTLASIGHRALRVHVATVDAFPSALGKYETTWSCLVNAVGDVEALKDELDDLKGDEELKEQVINYIWTACAQIRGELVFKARQKVSGTYGIPGNMTAQRVADIVQWMIKTCAFMYDDLDLKNKTFDKKTPFRNPLFKDLFISQWFSAKGEAIRCPDAFKHIPNPTLALICTSMECALNSWHHGTRSQVNFSEMQFKSRYQFYLSKLEHMQKDCPSWMKQFKKELYASICKESGHELLALDFDDDEDDIQEMYADMEKSALAKEGGGGVQEKGE